MSYQELKNLKMAYSFLVFLKLVQIKHPGIPFDPHMTAYISAEDLIKNLSNAMANIGSKGFLTDSPIFNTRIRQLKLGIK